MLTLFNIRFYVEDWIKDCRYIKRDDKFKLPNWFTVLSTSTYFILECLIVYLAIYLFITANPNSVACRMQETLVELHKVWEITDSSQINSQLEASNRLFDFFHRNETLRTKSCVVILYKHFEYGQGPMSDPRYN